ncbi:MAG TPA: ATP-binding protein [Alicyclobacillus sp.]|nr:ATP-binding protein [Alicyclobacillus sp.]
MAGLRLIEPDVEKVEIEDVIPSIWMKDIHSPVTLPSLGHGTSRLFDLTLALANAAHGILLVDEIENGLHYSVQFGIWKLMVDTARRSNVQVFATTHSWECIEAFQAALQDRHASGYLIRLNRREQGITATVYDQEELAIIVHDHVEVR